jgi:hypothetical protein
VKGEAGTEAGWLGMELEAVKDGLRVHAGEIQDIGCERGSRV